jgi:hypothetical protein
MNFKRGKRADWIKAQPSGGVAVRFDWNNVVRALIDSGALKLHYGENVERIRVDDANGITLFLETTKI